MKEEIKKSISESVKIISEVEGNVSQIEKVIEEIKRCFENQKKVILFGNGGSASDAQHIAAELIGKFSLERKSLPAIALTSNTSNITAIANDYSYDVVFSRQCESLVNSGDIVIGISTSGNSVNVINGLTIAKKNNACTIGLLGNGGGKIKPIVDLSIVVNSSSTPRIQEAHRVIYHIICEQVEKRLDIIKE